MKIQKEEMMNNNIYDVVIIGAGPAGISAAVSLKKSGIDNIIMLDREPVAGGIVRHCEHRSFGAYDYQRLLTGSEYANKLRKSAKKHGVEMLLKTTVTKYGKDGKISFVSSDGAGEITGKRVLITTGLRETPRSARLVTGQRPLGVMTTAAFQSMIYLEGKMPCENPVIIGTEIVSISALMTAKHSKMKPVAMIEKNKRMTLLPKPLEKLVSLFGTPVHLNTKIIDIQGDKRVESVTIEDAKGNINKLCCDGVIFTGEFVSHSTLIRASHLKLNTKTTAPIIDQFGRCSDPIYYATGNVLMPMKTGGKCSRLGKKTGKIIAKDLQDGL